MIQEVHPRVRAAVMWLPFVALGLLMRWSIAPEGRHDLQVPGDKKVIVSFQRDGKTPGVARFDAEAGSIAVAADGAERTLRWSCPGFNANVDPVSIRKATQSLLYRCYHSGDGKTVRIHGLFDPERMTLSWVEKTTDAAGKETSTRSPNLETPAFEAERRWLDDNP